MIVKFKKLFKDAVIPSFTRDGDAGMDACAAEACEIAAGGIVVVPTGIAVELPRDYEIQVRPRSGLAANFGITTLNSPGTIDSNYRGEIRVILVNHGKHSFRIEKGMRIAQLVVNKLSEVEIVEAEELSMTERNDKGFGSSGL